MPRSITLVRHAQSANNALPEQDRVPDPDITDLGHEQSRFAAQWLATIQPTRLYCSGFLRSLRTTDYVARQTGLRPYVHRELFEQGGCYAGHVEGELVAMPGMGRIEIDERFPEWEIDPNISVKGWWHGEIYESDHAAKSRATRIAQWLKASSELEGERSVLIIHADLIRLLLSVIFESIPWEITEDACNTSVTNMTLSGDEWKLQTYNSISHLPAKWIT